MLRSLQISNLALISSVTIDFDEGLNVLSGETGAGKSIIVDSLALLLGSRYDKTILRYGEKSGFVEGVFDVNNLQNELESIGIEDEDDYIIINRKFNSDGKSEIRVNGKLITLSMLKTITPKLIDLCGQNEHQSLSNVTNHLKVLDYHVRNSADPLKEKLKNLYNELADINNTLSSVGDATEREKTADYLRFQIQEIEEANVKEGEEEELVLLRKKIYGAETVKNAISSALANINGSEDVTALSDLLYDTNNQLSKITKYSDIYSSICERLNSVAIEIEDISVTLEDELSSLNFSEKDMDKVESRLNIVRQISRKYGTGKNLLDTLESFKNKLYEIENADEIYLKAQKAKETLIKEIYSISLDLSNVRKDGAKSLEKSIENELATLGMQSEFKVQFNELPPIYDCEKFISPNGFDKVEFYLSPNVGQPLNPLVKIISGGELSRLMLALKVVASEIDDTPTMIFDEIDTGISGKIGLEVAKKLAKLSTRHQLLCVTHLPQICAMADNNYYIEKTTSDNKTYTKVKKLSDKLVLEEIARLTGSRDISDQSLTASNDMKSWSDDFKKKL